MSLEERFWAKVRKAGPEDCWLWTAALGTQGYGAFDRQGAHRQAWKLAVGPIPPGQYVLHRCDHRWCVNPAHLFLGTHRDNIRDMTQKLRNAGERSRSKLTVAQVLEVRRRYRAGVPPRMIARALHVDAAVASAIGRGKSWKYLGDDGQMAFRHCTPQNAKTYNG